MPARGREGVSGGPPFESRVVYILSATERGGQGDPHIATEEPDGGDCHLVRWKGHG